MRAHIPKTFRLGSLMTRAGADVAGPGNFTIKRNVRRELAYEVTREGDRLFAPNGAIAVGNQPYPAGAAGTSWIVDENGDAIVDENGDPLLLGGEPITKFIFLRHPNGQGCAIACTATTIYRYYALDDPRYIVDTGPNTPYIETTGADTPYFDEDLSVWVVIGSGFSTAGHRWEIEAVNGYAVFNNGIDLPVRYRWNEYTVTPLHELREAGVIAVGTIHAHKGVLLCGDVTEFKAGKQADWMNGSDPYGRITDAELMNRVQYRVIWSGVVGEPVRWAANVLGAVEAGSDVVTLQWPMASLQTGMAILVAGAGTAGGNLVTEIAYIEGTTLVLVDPAETTVTDAIVARSDVTGQIAGSKLLQGDGSSVLRILTLQGQVVVLKGTGIVLGVYNGTLESPFIWDEETYKGAVSVFWRWVAINVKDDYILYAGRDRFWRWDPATRVPVEHVKLALCSDLFFDHAELEDMERVFAEDMDVTGEIWIKLPAATPDDTILAYDYRYDECNTLDRPGVTAFGMIDRPVAGAQIGPAERWGVYGLEDGAVLQYGLTNLGGAIYTRVGGSLQPLVDENNDPLVDETGDPIFGAIPEETYDSVLEEGLFAPGGDGDGGKVGGYLPLPAAHTGQTPPLLGITIEKFLNAPMAGVPAQVRTVAVREVNLMTKPLLPLYAKSTYFRARLTWRGAELKLGGRIWYQKPIPTRGAVRVQGATS